MTIIDGIDGDTRVIYSLDDNITLSFKNNTLLEDVDNVIDITQAAYLAGKEGLELNVESRYYYE